MKIEFFDKSDGVALTDTDDIFFVMNNEVYCDNNFYSESQEATLMFEDFVKKREDIGWRILNT